MSNRPTLFVAVIVLILALLLFGGVKSKAAGTVQHQISAPLCSYDDLASAVGSSAVQDWRIVAVPAVHTSKGTCLVIIVER
jgi:hypothetical protein